MIHLISIAHAGVITEAPTLREAGMNILNFFLSVVGILAIISLVVSGIIYFFSAGDENRMQTAKRSVKYSVLGILLAMSGFIIIRFMGMMLGE